MDRGGSRCTPDLAAVGPTGLPSPSVSQLTRAVPRSLWTLVITSSHGCEQSHSGLGCSSLQPP